MDAVDRKILSLLMEDGRRTYDEIAKQVELSAPSVKRRVDRLRESGALHGFTAVDMRNDMLPLIRAAKQQDWQTYRQLSAELQDLYLEGTVREAQAGAQIVHWPEMAVNLAKEDEADFLARTSQIAKDEKNKHTMLKLRDRIGVLKYSPNYQTQKSGQTSWRFFKNRNSERYSRDEWSHLVKI